ncbi:hypothetical protein HTZ84_11180 [Haloterrigena sp. SYSU A558-1]|uniref:Uncharacterized protein n=1 Tax=Haloterrigena gelatinilytica TaxID=2741724 RepID=A0ABX2LAX0_9EURY|nr:hypothetical protein [Haloterrigena gelatinilytica]NUC72866.1 hypothetical protein [Haloterrigena gelatinilytica]
MCDPDATGTGVAVRVVLQAFASAPPANYGGCFDHVVIYLSEGPAGSSRTD